MPTGELLDALLSVLPVATMPGKIPINARSRTSLLSSPHRTTSEVSTARSNCSQPFEHAVHVLMILAGRTVETGGFVGSVLSGVAPTDYHILDPSGEITGMAFTCDEFPPAMSIEGGANGANTYCAPAAAPDCEDKYTRSEQDFQSSAHGEIRQQRVSMGSTTGAYIVRH